MKIVNITFSLTGNGLIVANRIENSLVKDNHQIVHFDGCKLIKELNLQIREYPSPAQIESEGHPTLDELQSALVDADVIGLGSYVHWGLPTPGIYEMLFDSILKPSDFEKIKYCFTYCTHGSMSNPTKDQLFAYLHALNPAIQLLGSIDVRCPENVHFLLPRMPDQDGWSQSELDRLDKFVADLAAIMRSDPIQVPKQPSKPVSFDISANRKSMMKSEAKTRIVIDNDKCVRCGRCVSICPWNAMSFVPVQEEEKKEEEQKEEEKKEEEKKEEEKKEEEKKEEEKKEEEKKEEEKKDGDAPQPSSSSSSSSSDAPTPSKPKKKYDRVVINNADVCHRCTRCYNWCPTKAISVPPSAHERVQYTAVTYAAINKHPFSSSAPASSTAKPLEPKMGNLPSLPRILLRAVFD